MAFRIAHQLRGEILRHLLPRFIGLALQATPQVYAFLQTDIARFGISNSSNAFLFADFIPLDLGLFYAASHQLDVL